MISNYKNILTTICFLAFAFSGFASMTSYTYIDGNNNEYLIMEGSVTYKPITARESSSGTYNGGEAKNVAITSSQFQKIETLIKTILKDKSAHEATRQMGFGTVICGKKTVYLNVNSAHKIALEQELKNCLN